jgi:hypothetical protein
MVGIMLVVLVLAIFLYRVCLPSRDFPDFDLAKENVREETPEPAGKRAELMIPLFGAE